MKSLLPRLSLSLLCCALLVGPAAECRAQASKRATRGDEDPLAAAFRLADAMEEHDKDNVLVSLFRAHLEAGRLEEALRAASALDNDGTKALALSRVANAFADAGEFDRAPEILAESLRAALSYSDSNTLSQLLREMVGGTRFDYEEFPTARPVVGAGALARLMEAGRAKDAAGILSEVRTTALDPDFDDDDAAFVLARVARLYARTDAAKAAEVLSEAQAAARRLKDESDRVESLVEVASGHAAVGDVRAAEALLDEAAQLASARGDDRDRDLRKVVHAYAAAGLTAKAQKAAREVGGEDGAFAALEAVAAAADVPPASLSESLSRAVEAAASLEWENARTSRLTNLANLYGTRSADLLGKVEAAAASSLSDGYYRAQVLLAVGDAHAEAKRKAEALAAWGRALDTARAIELKREDLGPGDPRMNDRDKVSLLGAAARRLVGAGDYARAPEVARDIWATRVRAEALAKGSPAFGSGAERELARLADELTRAGRKAEALEVLGVAAAAGRPGRNTHAYEVVPGLAALGAAYARAGDEVRAGTCLRRALQLLAESDDDGDRKLLLMSNVGARYAEAGLKPDARARTLLRRLVRDVEEEQ